MVEAGVSTTRAATRPASRLVYPMLIACAVVYGAIFSANKAAATAGVPPLAYAFWQSFAAGLVLWLVLRVRGEKLHVGPAYLRSYIATGALAIGLPMALLAYVAPQLPAGLLTIVLAWSPPLTFLLSVAIRLERFRLTGLLGLAFGFLGVLVIIGPGMGAAPPGSWRWFLLALVAPLLFASSNLSAALLRPPVSSSLSMGAGMLFGSSAVLLVIMLLAGEGWMPAADAGGVAVLAAVGINAVFVVLFFEIIRRAGPTFFSQFNYLAVLAGVAWSMLLFGERFSIYFLLALLLMFIGVYFSVPRAKSAD